MNNMNTTEPKISEFYINSFLDRIVAENEVGGRFSVILPNGREIKLNPNERTKKIYFKIFNLQVPNILYNFATKTSRFFYELDYDEGTGVGTSVENIQINTQRVYSQPSDLITELNSKTSDLEFSYDDLTKRVTVKNITSPPVKVRIISSFRYGTTESVLTFNDINDRLGFSQDLTGSNGVLDFDESLVGSGLIQMNRTNAYHLVLEESGSSHAQSIVPMKEGANRVVCNVPVGSFGSLSTLAYVSSEWFNLPSQSQISVLRFRLLDDEMDDLSNEFAPNYPITLSFQLKVE
jgi:hypothetical protein